MTKKKQRFPKWLTIWGLRRRQRVGMKLVRHFRKALTVNDLRRNRQGENPLSRWLLGACGYWSLASSR